MPMRQDCKHFESRTYPNGETVRKCNLDLAPEAPWRCPDDCPKYERRLADVNWSHGTLVTPRRPTSRSTSTTTATIVAALLDEAEDDHQRGRPADPGRGRGRAGPGPRLAQDLPPQALTPTLVAEQAVDQRPSAFADRHAADAPTRRSGATAASPSSTSTRTTRRRRDAPPPSAIPRPIEAALATVPVRGATVVVVNGRVAHVEVDVPGVDIGARTTGRASAR